MTIAIQNAQPGHCQQVGLKRAERLVKRGRATWVDDTRSTIVIAPHVLTAQEIDAQSAITRAIRQSERHYDRIDRVMSAEEIANLPTAGPAERMLTLGSTHLRPYIGRSGPCRSVAPTQAIAHELRACGLVGVRT